MTAHRSPTKSRRPLSSVPAGRPPGMRLSRRCRLSEAPNTIEGYGQPSSAVTGQKKTLTSGPQVPENQHCPRQSHSYANEAVRSGDAEPNAAVQGRRVREQILYTKPSPIIFAMTVSSSRSSSGGKPAPHKRRFETSSRDVERLACAAGMSK